MRLSENETLDAEVLDRALEQPPRTVDRLQIGYVVVDRRRSSPELIDFARRAFQLSFVDGDEELELYRTPIAAPPSAVNSILVR